MMQAQTYEPNCTQMGFSGDPLPACAMVHNVKPSSGMLFTEVRVKADQRVAEGS